MPLTHDNSIVDFKLVHDVQGALGIDTLPDGFTFTDQTDVALSTLIESDVITVAGVDAGQDIPITVTGGEYAVSTDGGSSFGAWTSAGSNVQLNQQIKVRGTSSGSLSTQTDIVLTVGGVSDTFSLTTTDDSTPPVITLTGSASVNLDQGTPWSEIGFTATDNVDGDITLNVVIGGDAVDHTTVGSYTITYDVADSQGNNAVQVTRTVTVADNTIPVISLVGNSTVNIQAGAVWADPGYSAIDNNDGVITGSVVVGGQAVNTGALGSYVITYDVADAAGNNAATVQRTVNVVDTTNPVISLIGGSTVNLELGTPWVELGYSATDNLDGDVTGSVVIGGDVVDHTTTGTYTITYNVDDSQGNSATQVTRTVQVFSSTLTLNPFTVVLCPNTQITGSPLWGQYPDGDAPANAFPLGFPITV